MDELTFIKNKIQEFGFKITDFNLWGTSVTLDIEYIGHEQAVDAYYLLNPDIRNQARNRYAGYAHSFLQNLTKKYNLKAYSYFDIWYSNRYQHRISKFDLPIPDKYFNNRPKISVKFTRY